MKPLSTYLNERFIEALKKEIKRGAFPKISFELAMQFILTDGILPESDLPASSFLKLEDWTRSYSPDSLTYTTTSLKNKTGEILDQVMQGKTIHLSKHGRIIAEIKRSY